MSCSGVQSTGAEMRKYLTAQKVSHALSVPSTAFDLQQRRVGQCKAAPTSNLSGSLTIIDLVQSDLRVLW